MSAPDDAAPADDCFALPPGMRWTPVDEAWATLRERVRPMVGTETVGAVNALGRIVAEDVQARWDVPRHANAAVDGYAFAADSLGGVKSGELPLHPGRVAAGHAMAEAVPAGAAVRIFTGAVLPDGVDTVVLQEDTEPSADSATVRILRVPKAGANTRSAGEDIAAGGMAVPAGQQLRPQDVAQLAAAGIDQLAVHQQLRVGVLSTGDEIREPTAVSDVGDVADANRPMLRALVSSTGCLCVDFGIVPDDADAVRTTLERASQDCDVLITSGGASGGDEDHIARLLAAEDKLHVWRIAMKPGRPLVMGHWGSMPTIGLPGNPVAVFVCFLLFARPALLRWAGALWTEPRRYRVPLAESHRKKPGRREFLRARINDAGAAERFHSEGSGLISGLRWSDGLVELHEDETVIEAGQQVNFIPYSELGISGYR